MEIPPRSFTIRPAAGVGDGAVLVALIRRLAEFERLTAPDENAARRIIEHGFGTDQPKYQALLAFDDTSGDEATEAIGYAVVFETYSTFLGKPTLYLEDLFVLPDHRGRGIGKALLMRCIAIANERGCGRMEWSVLDWNTEAQRFYQSLDAKHLAEWHLYRLDETALARLAAS